MYNTKEYVLMNVGKDSLGALLITIVDFFPTIIVNSDSELFGYKQFVQI